MLTVYLDQNKWIDLARAQTGHPLGAPFVETLAVLTWAVNEGRARFPLSAAHYYETGKQRDRRKRQDLAATMMHLSGTMRIAPPPAIVPWEISRALVAVLGLPHSIPDMAILGEGAAHAFARPTLRYTAPTEWEGHALPPDVRMELQRRANPEYETLLLAGATPEGMPDDMRIVLNDVKSLTDERFVQGQRNVAEAITKFGRHRLEEVMIASTYADIMDPLVRAGIELGVGMDELLDNMRPIVEAIPSRWVEMKLRHQRQANPQKAWHGHDLNDVTALAIAVPYCDVVVTERSWSSMLDAAKVPARFGHTVTPRLRDVVDLLGT